MVKVLHPKHILFICHRIPFPPNKGEKIRSYNILKYLGQDNRVSLAFLIDAKEDVRHLDQLTNYCINRYCDNISQKFRKLWSAIKAFVYSTSISNQYFYSKKLQQKVDQLIDDKEIDMIVCSSSPTSEYIFQSRHFGGKLKKTPMIMDFIDVDSHKWRQYAASKKFLSRALYNREAKKICAEEKRIIKTFTRTLIISEAEKIILNRYHNSQQTEVIGNGVDLVHFSDMKNEKNQSDKLILTFTGAMDYWPNIEGVSWFANFIFPLIRNQLSDVEFHIVGRNPTVEVKKLEINEGVVVTGAVEDIRDHLAIADVCVVPLRIARGIQNKVLEAMAMAKPIVCTAQAADGICARDGQDLLIANDAETFAEVTVTLLQDEDNLFRLGQKARESVEKNHSWSASLQHLSNILY